ncbi:MAG: CopG family transcriptional regulator [Bryobacteraceae bacterium]
MPHLTIYLADDVEKNVRAAAKKEGLSINKWIALKVARTVASQWPDAVLKAAGVLPDFPDLEELRAGGAIDTPRDSL